MLSQTFRQIRLEEKSKNFLIFLPFFFESNINYSQVINSILAFLIFFFLTNLIYIINDFSDRHSDQFNELKRDKKIDLKNSFLIFLCSFFVLVILYFNKNYLFNQFIFFYILNFIIYNYLAKKIKFIDLFFLANFYLIRIFYGFEIHKNIEISFGLSIFFFILFVKLAILKRIIQINSNKNSNLLKIICYNKIDIKVLKKIVYFLTLANLILIFIYFFYLFSLINLNFLFLEISNINIVQASCFTIYYLYFVNKIFISFKTKKINIIKVFMKDKFFLIFTFIFLFTYIIYK